MFSFFGKTTDTQALAQRIFEAQQQSDSLARQADKADTVLLNTNLQLLQWESEYYACRTLLQTQQDNLMQQQQECAELQQQGASRSQHQQEVNERMHQALSDYQHYQAQLAGAQQEEESLRERIHQCMSKINDLDDIISEPGPIPLYGNYCVNGHLNCPNLPHTVYRLGNAAEVEAHERKIEHAQVERDKQQALRDHLQAQYDEVAQHAYSLEQAVLTSHADYEQCQYDKDSLEQAFGQNNQQQTRAEQAYENLLQATAELQLKVDQADQAINTYSCQLLEVNQEANLLKQQWQAAEQALMRLQANPQDEVQRLENRVQQLDFTHEQDNAQAINDSLRFDASSTIRDDASISAYPPQAIVMQTEKKEEQTSTWAVDNIHTLEHGAESLYNNVKEGLQHTRQFVKDLVTTTGDLWPHAGTGLFIKATMQGAERVSGMESQPTGDLFIDNANRNTK